MKVGASGLPSTSPTSWFSNTIKITWRKRGTLRVSVRGADSVAPAQVAAATAASTATTASLTPLGYLAVPRSGHSADRAVGTASARPPVGEHMRALILRPERENKTRGYVRSPANRGGLA